MGRLWDLKAQGTLEDVEEVLMDAVPPGVTFTSPAASGVANYLTSAASIGKRTECLPSAERHNFRFSPSSPRYLKRVTSCVPKREKSRPKQSTRNPNFLKRCRQEIASSTCSRNT